MDFSILHVYWSCVVTRWHNLDCVTCLYWHCELLEPVSISTCINFSWALASVPVNCSDTIAICKYLSMQSDNYLHIFMQYIICILYMFIHIGYYITMYHMTLLIYLTRGVNHNVIFNLYHPLPVADIIRICHHIKCKYVITESSSPALERCTWIFHKSRSTINDL